MQRIRRVSRASRYGFLQQPEVEIQVGREHRPATAAVIRAGDPDFPRLLTPV